MKKDVMMKKKTAINILIVICVVSAILLAAILIDLQETRTNLYAPAPAFSAVDHMGRNFAMEDFAGNVTVILFTQFENPLCIECEEYMHAEISALEDLSESGLANVSLVTINIRKNQYSDDGWSIAGQAYGVNITWHWVEEIEPFPVATQYIKYWNIDGSFANPTLILVNQSGQVVAVYHIYCIGKGSIDGIISATLLESNIKKILSGEWQTPAEPIGELASSGTLAGMLLLGVITSFSPCSIALLMAVVSFVGARGSTTVNKIKRESLLSDGLKIGIFFTIGTAMVFMIFGLFLSYIGEVIQASTIFYLIAGIMLVFFGINAVVPITEIMKGKLKDISQKLFRKKSNSRGEQRSLNFLKKLRGRSAETAGFGLGVLFSIGWAPCALTLVLPVLILMIAQDLSAVEGVLMMLFFGIGHGIIIIPFCAATGGIRGSIGNRYISAAKWTQLSFAIVLFVVGALFIARIIGFNLW